MYNERGATTVVVSYIVSEHDGMFNTTINTRECRAQSTQGRRQTEVILQRGRHGKIVSTFFPRQCDSRSIIPPVHVRATHKSYVGAAL